MAFKKTFPTIVSAHPTTGTYTDKNGIEQTYEAGVLFILYYEEGAKLPHHGIRKKCTREALNDIKGATFPIVNPRLFEQSYEGQEPRVVGIKI